MSAAQHKPPLHGPSTIHASAALSCTALHLHPTCPPRSCSTNCPCMAPAPCMLETCSVLRCSATILHPSPSILQHELPVHGPSTIHARKCCPVLRCSALSCAVLHPPPSILQHKLPLHGPGTIHAGDYQWPISFTLPANVPGTFHYDAPDRRAKCGALRCTHCNG
jgi:hypothetical protein